MSLVRKISFDIKGDGRGDLIALESHKNIPFDIKRVYYLTGMKSDTPRGYHAHRKLQQVVVCLSGKCRMVLDDGSKREEIWLDSSTFGLVINNLVWREMHDFSEGCVLLVLASEYYDESDYLRDYDVFLKETKNRDTV